MSITCPRCWKNEIVEQLIIGQGGLTCPRCGWVNPPRNQPEEDRDVGVENGH